MNWHENQVNQSLRHANEHRNNMTPRTRDLSCRICYPVNEGTTDEKFKNFWGWYQGITSAERFSANAESVFEELMGKNLENIIEGRENFQINALIYSMGYRDNSGFSIKDIRARIVDMTSVSEKFTRDMEEAAESYKTKSSGEESSSKENSPSKEESPKKTSPREISPKAEGSRINRKEVLEIEEKLRGFEELKDNDVEVWEEKSTEELFSKEEKEKWERDFELRRLKRLEKIENIDDLESVISEENPHSSLGMRTPAELLENNITEMDNDGVIRKVRRDTKRDELMERLKSLNEEIKKDNEENKIFEDNITEENTDREKNLFERTYEWITAGTKGSLIEEKEKERKYEKEKPVYRKTPIGTSDKSTDDEEFFNERYNERRRKYDRIKKLMGDEIDEELNNA